jgi:hypothetical protein
VGKVSETVDSIVMNLQELQGLKKQGFTREDWLKTKIDNSTEKLTEEIKIDVINAVRCGLITANKEMGIPVPETGVKVLSPFEGLNAKVIVSDLTSEIRDNTLLGAISFESGSINIDKKHKEIKAVKEYFESKLDSPNDPLFVKAVSTATVIAKDKGLLPKVFENKSPEALAMIVDKGVTNAKVFSKIGSGELSLMDGVDYMIDRNVSRIGSIVVKSCTEVGGKIGTNVGAFVGSIFGPAGTALGAAVGNVVGKVAGYAVGNLITTGLKKAGAWVKDTARNVYDGCVNFCSGVADFVSGLFS